MDLIPLAAQDYDLGKSAIMALSPAWDGSGDLFAQMTHLGTMEGVVDPAMNPEYSELKLEDTGPAAIKRYLTGERPTFTINVFPNPDNMKIFSPTGLGSAGGERQRAVNEYTLWIVAEQLFLAPDPVSGFPVPVPVTFDGTDFLKNGVALTSREQNYIDMSMLIWRADFSRLTPKYQLADGGKSIKEITVTVQQDFTKPNGCQLFLMLAETSLFGVEFIGS